MSVYTVYTQAAQVYIFTLCCLYVIQYKLNYTNIAYIFRSHRVTLIDSFRIIITNLKHHNPFQRVGKPGLDRVIPRRRPLRCKKYRAIFGPAVQEANTMSATGKRDPRGDEANGTKGTTNGA